MVGGGTRTVTLTLPGIYVLRKMLKLLRRKIIRNRLTVLSVLEILLIFLGSIIVEYVLMLAAMIARDRSSINSELVTSVL